MKKPIVFFFLLCCAGCAIAQSLAPKTMPASGGYSTGGTNSLSWTIGEVFNTTLSAGTVQLSQGEQQPEIELLTGNVDASACIGGSFSVPYTSRGYVDATNVFTAQLSDASGSFISPTNIGTRTGTFSGTINAVIPASAPAGTNYRIRVISSKPVYTGKVSGSPVILTSAGPTSATQITAAPAAGCVGNTATLTANSVSGATAYNWSCTQGGILFDGNPSPYASASPSVTITFTTLPPAGSSGWSVCVFAGNACGNSNTACKWIRSTVSRPTPITGSTVGCPGSTGSAYSVPAVTGAATYVWTGTGGITATGNGTTATIDFSTAFNTGTLCVYAQTVCGFNSPSTCITISKAPAVPSTITGASYVCPSAPATFSIAPVQGAVSYTWTTSVPGAVVTPSGASCSVLFPASIPGGSTVCVAAISACGFASTIRCKGIASGLPATPSNIQGLAAGQCGQTGVSYSINPVSFASSYQWTVTGGATFTGPTNLSGVSVNFPSAFANVTLSVQALNSCGSGPFRNLTITGAPATPPSITGNTAVCAGSTETYSTTGSTGASAYQWTVPAGANIIGPLNGASIIVQWGATGGNVTCRAVNSCGTSAQRTYPVTVNCRIAELVESADGMRPVVFPNPASKEATVVFASPIQANFQIVINDFAGQVVYKEKITATEGINLVELDLAKYAKGTYSISIEGNGKIEKLRVKIQ